MIKHRLSLAPRRSRITAPLFASKHSLRRSHQLALMSVLMRIGRSACGPCRRRSESSTLGFTILSQYSGTDSADAGSIPMSAGDDRAASPRPRKFAALRGECRGSAGQGNRRSVGLQSRWLVDPLYLLVESVIHAAGDPPLAAIQLRKPDAERDLNAGSATSVGAVSDGTGNASVRGPVTV